MYALVKSNINKKVQEKFKSVILRIVRTLKMYIIIKEYGIH